MDQTKRKLSPFLQGALEKDESERSFLERMAVNIYGPILEADEDRNKPAAVLDESYKDFVQTLPADVQLDIDRYLNIFIVFFFSGTIVSLIFDLIDYILFRNSDFNLNNWAYSNLVILSIMFLAVYSWTKKNHS